MGEIDRYIERERDLTFFACICVRMYVYCHLLSLLSLSLYIYIYIYIIYIVCLCECMYMCKSWRQHPTRHQLYSHLPPITKTIQVRRTRHAGPCWRSRDELINDVLLWTPTHGRAKAWRPARTYIQQLYEDTGGCPEDLLEAMNDREKWRERVRDIRATSTTWWWWWWCVCAGVLLKKWSVLTCDFKNMRRIFIEITILAS